MKLFLSILLIVFLSGCIQTENEYWAGKVRFVPNIDIEKNIIRVIIDERGYLMLNGAMNGNPISVNLDSVYMEMHNERTKSYNIYDEQIVKR